MTFAELLADHSDEELKEALTIFIGEDNAETSGKTTQETQSQTYSKTQVVPYNNTNYESEKRQGLRRANGARKLKKLSNRHLEIISRHLQGQSGETISASMGVTFITVSRVLNDPLAKDLVSVVYEGRQGELDALAGLAISAIRDGLDAGKDVRIRLQSVDKFTKLKDSIGKEETSSKTAEDVVAEIFNKVEIGGDAQIQFNIGKGNG